TLASCVIARHHAVGRGDISTRFSQRPGLRPHRDRHAGSLGDASEGSFLHDRPVAKATTLTTPNRTRLAAMIQNKPSSAPCNTVIQYQPPMVTTARRTQPAMNGQSTLPAPWLAK